MKTCRKCGETKGFDQFSPFKAGRNGLYPWCKPCVRARTAAYDKANPLQAQMRSAKSYRLNKEKILARSAARYAENREAIRERHAKYQSRWQKENAAVMAAHAAKRRAQQAKATPEWASSEWEQLAIGEVYDLAARRSALTGFAWHVDHVVPLTSKIVCGLHCIANLQVIPGLENQRKKNISWPDQP